LRRRWNGGLIGGVSEASVAILSNVRRGM
jgi:hypothetical protein